MSQIEYFGDALTYFTLHSYNSKEIKPCITIGYIKIDENTSEITYNDTIYNFDKFATDLWINVLCLRL